MVVEWGGGGGRGIGIFPLADLANFWFGFSFFALTENFFFFFFNNFILTLNHKFNYVQ